MAVKVGEAVPFQFDGEKGQPIIERKKEQSNTVMEATTKH